MFIFNALHKVFLIGSILLITGCGSSYFTHRDTNPIIKDNTNNARFWGGIGTRDAATFSTFSTTASRRMIVVLQNKNTTEVCSEPSPDVGETFASAVADAIAAKAPVQGVPLELSNQYSRAVSTQIASLIYRTQGLQLYRDAMHNLCVDKMNTWLDNIQGNNSYENLRKYYFDKAVELITTEVQGKNINDLEAKVKTGTFADIEQASEMSIKLINATKPTPANK
jgi:hypothetical protein